MTEQKETDANTALLIYGIVPAGTEPKVEGIGETPGPVRIVSHGDIAALVSEIPVDQPLDRAEDLQAFARVVDGLVTETSVIPLRFGAALENPQAVEDGLLAPNEGRFRAALEELKGLAEFLVKGTYVEETVLREVLEENSDAAALRETIRSSPPELTRDSQIALGEIINAEIEAKREADGQLVADALGQVTRDLTVRPPTQELEVVDIAVLVALEKQEELLKAVNVLAEHWQGRVEMRVVGPLAAWDFVAFEGVE
ncbi:GvpL/GvpF family gas vesicle protein [Nocardia sp. NPDC050406]|uniref:GvpL/GvpF family gas vesicle protein n=1 Tax=Nocardia sp. NPDC050406 TaxID=3364318 RepID=UPI0037B1E510